MLNLDQYFIGKLIFDVRGWLSQDEAFMLYSIAQKAKGDILEIGSYCGKSTICLCLGSESGTNQVVWSIDRFDSHNTVTQEEGKSTHEEFWDNICNKGVEKHLRVIVDDTQSIIMKEQAETFELGMLFHDGSHEYEDVKADLALYVPQIVHEGYLCIHDYNPAFPGVVKAVDEFAEITQVGLISSNMWVGEKI